MILFLLAAEETPEGKVAILMALSTIIGGAAAWIYNKIASRLDEKRKDKKDSEKTIVDHLQLAADRQEKELVQLRVDIKDTNWRLTNTLAHVRYLEGIMESKGIAFRPLVDQDGTERVVVDGGGGHG